MDTGQGHSLVRWARQTIEAALGGPPAEIPGELWCQQPGASFVTLTKGGALRGCIGSLEARRALADDVQDNALAAAFRDPRFPPVTKDEVRHLRIEVSVLSPQIPIPFETETEALASLKPGVDGVVFESGFHRATFLPQVWDQLPDRRQFLGHLKAKAGLSPDFWGAQVRLWRYTVEHWEEDR